MNASRRMFHLTKINYYNRCASRLVPLTALKSSDKVVSCRNQSTTPKTISANKPDGFVMNLLSKVPFLDINKIKLRSSAHLLYEEVADKLNYVDFLKAFNLPDTFYTWFVITELHIWMLLVRVMAEGEDGQYVRNFVIQAMWADVNTRVKKLGAGFASQIQEKIMELCEQFQATIVSYDEGLQLNDRILANALWRRVFQQNCDKPEDLELMVAYVRKQIKLLDDLSSQEILYNCQIKWVAV